jgi:hypothetical protein
LDDDVSAVALSKNNLDILRDLQGLEKRGDLVGVFSDVPIEVYHHPECPGTSSTDIKAILRSLNYWGYQQTKKKTTDALRFGNAFHTYVLEPDLMWERYEMVDIIPSKYDPLTSPGKILLLPEELSRIEIMDSKIHAHPDASLLFQDARREVTFFSIDPLTGIVKKCRADIWRGCEMTDLKSTTDASEDAFTYDCGYYDYPISAAFYMEVGTEASGMHINLFNVVAAESEEPHDVAVYDIDGDVLFNAEKLIRVAMKRIDESRKALARGEVPWVGYPVGIKTIRPRLNYRALIGD